MRTPRRRPGTRARRRSRSTSSTPARSPSDRLWHAGTSRPAAGHGGGEPRGIAAASGYDPEHKPRAKGRIGMSDVSDTAERSPETFGAPPAQNGRPSVLSRAATMFLKQREASVL